MTTDRFSFNADALVDPDEVDSAFVDSVLSGTYRSNWAILKQAAYSATYCCIVNMSNHLLPTAERIRAKNPHLGEQAFLLGLNHSNLIGGPAVGSVALIAFAQESFMSFALDFNSQKNYDSNGQRMLERGGSMLS